MNDPFPKAKLPTGSLPMVSVDPARRRDWERGHPWIFSGSVKKAPHEAGFVNICFGDSGQPEGMGFYFPERSLAIRRIGCKNIQKIPETLKALLTKQTRNYVGRIINSDHHGFPGLIADQYGNTTVLQAHSLAAEYLLETAVDILTSYDQTVVIRNDGKFRRRENLPNIKWTSAARPEGLDHHQVIIRGIPIIAPLWSGQKTGLFLDHQIVDTLLSGFHVPKGARFLNLFSYLGLTTFSFIENFKANDVTTVSVDQSEFCKKVFEEQRDLLKLPAKDHLFLMGDIPDILKDIQPGFDVMVIDPPNLTSKKADKQAALRFYQMLLKQAQRLGKPGTQILLGSCSHYLEMEDFHRIFNGFLVKVAGTGSPEYPTLPLLNEAQYFRWFWLEFPG